MISLSEEDPPIPLGDADAQSSVNIVRRRIARPIGLETRPVLRACAGSLCR